MIRLEPVIARPETAARIVAANAAPGSEAFRESADFVTDRRERQTAMRRQPTSKARGP
jgi:hypothetical protein